jgi:hypothetical protein
MYIFRNHNPKTTQELYSISIVGLLVLILFIIFHFSIIATLLILVLVTGFIIFFGFASVGSIYYYILGIIVIRKERGRPVNSDIKHDALIICIYKYQLKLPSYGDGIHWLIKYLRQNERPYIVYSCYEPKDFRLIVLNPKALNLWIFGHGTRSSLNFGTGINQNYRELEDAPKKFFVGQFHCNGFDDPEEKSLVDIISYYGYVTEGKISEMDVRQAIQVLVNIRKIENNKPLEEV